MAKYIFSINTGRSGSEYLHRIFDRVPNCQSFHEPVPVGRGHAMRSFLSGREHPMEKISHDKARFVQDHSQRGTVYFESNHCFIKGFGWFMARHLPEDELGIIILKRDRDAIAKSYWRVGCSPLRSFGRNWLITPAAKRTVVAPPRLGKLPPKPTYWIAKLTKDLFSFLRSTTKHFPGPFFHDPAWVTRYELEALRWYVDETHAKATQFRERFPRARYYEITIDDLNSLKEIHKMLGHFGLTATDDLSDIVGKPTNLKQS